MNECIDINACCEDEREGECRGGEVRYIACVQSHLDCPRCAEKNKQIRELEAHLQTENDRHVQDHTRAEELTKQLAQAQRSADKWQQAFLKLYAEGDAVA